MSEFAKLVCPKKHRGFESHPYRQFMYICLRCDGEEFDIKEDAVFEQIYREEHLMVHTPGVVCRKCGWQTVGNDQIDGLIQATKKAYEKEVTENRSV